MTTRNSTILLIATVLSLVCYHRASHNRYASAIAEAMGEINTQFVKPVDSRVLFEGSLRGMTRELDDYSGYIPPKRYEQLMEDIDQRFGGIGIVVDIDEETERLVVVSPLLDTPAYKAGLKPGDLIMKIGDTENVEKARDTDGMTTGDTVDLIRGEPGTEVFLWVQSDGQTEQRVVPVERAIIPVQSVLGDRRRSNGSWSFVLEDHPEMGYVRLISFGENSAADLQAAIDEVAPDVKALILDLRGNGGGLLDAAVDICDMFIAEGLIVSVNGRDKSDRVEHRATGATTVPTDLPMVVLVDHYSASASEITSACLQDYKRATVIGERTWGKGTVQRLIELEGGRSALRLTTATYWRPSGKNIHRLARAKPEEEWGVQPNEDFNVPYTDEQRREVMIARRNKDAKVLGSDDDAANDKDGEGSEDAGAPPELEEPSSETANENQTDGDAGAETESDPVVDLQLIKAIEFLKSQIDGGQSNVEEPASPAAEDVLKKAA